MNLLGIDYGRKKVGLAISSGKLAEPLKVIRYKDIKILNDQIRQIIKQEQVGKVIVGISEGEMGEESKKFAKIFNAETFDETLSSHDAQQMSIQSGMGRKKRKEMEDAFAACIMLQSYIDYV